MAGLNKVMLIGRLGKDPELKFIQSGAAVCQFPLATSEKWNDKSTGQQKEKTEWHNIVAWGKQAETLEKYLSKGSQVYIEGSLQTRNYDKDGQTHYTTEIKVYGFQFLDGKEKQTEQAPRQPEQREDDSDIPF